MTPIISPWVFYAMNVCDTLQNFALIVVICIVIFLIVVLPILYIEFDDIKVPKKTIVFLLSILLAISIFCPSESTIMKMIVAQNVTYERVEIANETVQDIYEDIISLVDNDKNEEE